MKKILNRFSTLIAPSSFKNNYKSNNLSNWTLLKQIIFTDSSGQLIESIQYSYNENKLVSITKGNHKSNYTYSGDKIIKIEDSEKNILNKITEYTYNSDNKLHSSIETEIGSSYSFKTLYSYNLNGTVTFKEFMINSNTETISDEGSMGKFVFSQHNLIKIEKSNNNGYEFLATYEYDRKNNPFKNVLGFNLIFNFPEKISTNNIIKSTNTFDSFNFVNTHSYSYNSIGFPIRKKSFYEDELTQTTQFLYL